MIQGKIGDNFYCFAINNQQEAAKYTKTKELLFISL